VYFIQELSEKMNDAEAKMKREKQGNYLFFMVVVVMT